MQFTCKSDELRKSVALVEKAVSQKSSLPVLENIFLELKGTFLKLRGNNLEIGIENGFFIENSSGDGCVLIKAKTLSGIISRLSDENVSISVDENQNLAIKGSQVDFDILGSDAQDYPVFPAIDDGFSLSLSVGELRDLIKHTIIAVSYDETKQFLNGIMIKNEQDKLLFVSTDGYRLALKQQTIPPVNNDFNSIVPFKAVSELNRILQGLNSDKNVEIIISENQIVFKLESFILISRLIQGQFPDYKQVVPKESENKFLIDRQQFLAAAERAAIIATASNNVVRFLFDNDKLEIFANAKGLGDFKEAIAIERKNENGDTVKIAFNVRLVLDVIKTLTTEKIMLEFNNELSPCKITLENDDSFTYIIMPIRTTDYQS
jgi:DNA polymerase III subunit beta